MTDARPQFVRSDAALLTAVTEHYSRRRRPQKLWELLHDYDWLSRAVPFYDELSYGLARLVAAGYVKVQKSEKHGIRLRATEDGAKLGVEARRGARLLIDPTLRMDVLLGCNRYPEPETEDRSNGRLKGLERSDYDAARKQYDDWWEAPWGSKFANWVRGK